MIRFRYFIIASYRSLSFKEIKPTCFLYHTYTWMVLEQLSDQDTTKKSCLIFPTWVTPISKQWKLVRKSDCAKLLPNLNFGKKTWRSKFSDKKTSKNNSFKTSKKDSLWIRMVLTLESSPLLNIERNEKPMCHCSWKPLHAQAIIMHSSPQGPSLSQVGNMSQVEVNAGWWFFRNPGRFHQLIW